MASSVFPLDEAQLVTLFVESVLYGMLLVSFAACIRVLWLQRRRNGNVNRPMLSVATAMAVVATVSVAFGLRHVLDAFIRYHGPGGPNGEFENISYWVNVMKAICYYAQTFIGDLTLIYRCFIVYNRRWLVISCPLVVWMGTLTCGILTIQASFALKVNTTIDEKILIPRITSALVLTMVQNLITTTLIAIRIWSIEREVAPYRSTPPVPVIRMIIESGAVYTLSVAVFLIVYVCRDNAQYPVAAAIVQIIGIVFNMIVIRVHQSHTTGQATANTDRGSSITFSGHANSPSDEPLSPPKKAQWRPATSRTYPLQPMQVTVTRQVVQDTDSTGVWESKVTTDEIPSIVHGDV